MKSCSFRKQRLEYLLDLARSYRGWTRKDLAAALHRDPTKLVPASGTPKIDLVVDLAGVLDWSVEAIVNYLWNGKAEDLPPLPPTADFDSLDAAALLAHREGRYADMIAIAKQSARVAVTPDQQATACNREAGGADGLGRYPDALDALHRALRINRLSPSRRRMLQANLANACYTLWNLIEARTIASDLIDHSAHHPSDARADRVIAAFAHYVHGQSLRRSLNAHDTVIADDAQRAIDDLSIAQDAYQSLAVDFDDDSYRGIANTCEGAILELEAALGRRSVEDVLTIFETRLERLIDPAEFPVGDLLEAHGWWCIFGCNVALRQVEDEKRLQSAMAVFTNKADEIANHLDNWAMRERVFTLEYARRQRFVDWTGIETKWTLDRDDLRVITGTMGRFPDFQQTGWQILNTARMVV